MQQFKVFAILVAGAFLSVPALAQQTTTDTAPAATMAAPAQPAAPADDPNERICRSGEPILGSRFPGPRVCHTRKEWAQIQQDSQKAVFDQQMKRAGPGNGQ